MSHIPYGRQSIIDEDIESIMEVLHSDWLTQGPKIMQFEQAIADYCHAKAAVAVSNATAALHLACLALGVGNNDIVWTTPNTFLSSANCARFCGARVDFVDICSRTYNMSLDALNEKLISAEKNNCLPKVVIPVHFAGQSCDMRGIQQLANRYHFKVIEDASHAIGGQYLDKPVGCCEYSDMTVFSFHPVKVMTTGEGGAVLTNDDELCHQLKLLRSHGMTRDEGLMTKASDGPWYYEQLMLGFNYRITDLQCALGLKQLRRINSFVKRRHELVANYQKSLAHLPLILPFQHPDVYSAFHLYVIQIDSLKTNKTRKQLFDEMRTANIGVNVHYIPVHLQPYYQRLGFKRGDFPVAEKYYQHTITLPLYYELSIEQQQRVISALEKGLA